MNLREMLRERVENPDFQKKLIDRITEPVTEGGKYGDLLKLWELVEHLDRPLEDRPMRQYTDGELWAMLENLTARGITSLDREARGTETHA